MQFGAERGRISRILGLSDNLGEKQYTGPKLVAFVSVHQVGTTLSHTCLGTLSFSPAASIQYLALSASLPLPFSFTSPFRPPQVGEQPWRYTLSSSPRLNLSTWFVLIHQSAHPTSNEVALLESSNSTVYRLSRRRAATLTVHLQPQEHL